MSTTATAGQNLVEIRLWGASGQVTGQTAHHIFTLNGSNDADSRKGFGVF